MRKTQQMKGFKFLRFFMAVIALLGFAAAGAVGANGITELFANGTAKSTDAMGIANRYFGGSQGRTVASADLTVTNQVGEVYGGGKAKGTEAPNDSGVTGDTVVYLAATAVSNGAIYGGGLAEYGTHAVGGNTRIAMKTPAKPTFLYGGGKAYPDYDGEGGYVAGNSIVNGNTTIEITNGTILHTAHLAVMGGGEAWSGGMATVEGDTNILISGGSFGDPGYVPDPEAVFDLDFCSIYGGGVAYSDASANVKGNTNITISGGTFYRIPIFGGGMVYHGHTNAAANVEGNATITIKGAAGLATIGGAKFIRGGGNPGEDAESNNSAEVKGTKSLVFDGVGTGTVNADIKDFDVVLFRGTNAVTFAKVISADVKKVKIEGTFTEDATVLILADGSHKPEVDTTGAQTEWDGLKLIAKGGSGPTPTDDPAKPAKPVFDEETEKALSGDVAAETPAIPANVGAAVVLLEGTGITAADLESDGAGQPRLTEEAVKKADTAVTKVFALPVFSATLSNGATAKILSCAFEVSGSQLLAATPEEVKLLKVKGTQEPLYFNYSDTAEDFKTGGAFTIQKADDTVAARAGAIDTEAKYKVTLFIEDNGAYDLDGADAKILDPCALVLPDPEPSGSSSGCNSGAFALAALLGGAILVLKGKR